jgi:hypothetical protein
MNLITKSLICLIFLWAFTSPGLAVEVNLKFSGGICSLNLKDINRPISDWMEWKKKDTEAHSGWTYIGGETSSLHRGFDFEGEILVSITRRIALGVGAGYIYGELQEEKTALTIERLAGTFFDVKPITVSALHLSFLGYYFLPIRSDMKLYAKAGAGVVWGKYIDREGRRLETNENFTYQTFQRTSGRGSIFLGGLGFEYEFEPGMRIFFELSARVSKITDFEGENEREEIGILYSFEEYDQNYLFWQKKVQIQTAEPQGDNFRSVQRTVVDIGGASVKLGLMFKF